MRRSLALLCTGLLGLCLASSFPSNINIGGLFPTESHEYEVFRFALSHHQDIPKLVPQVDMVKTGNSFSMTYASLCGWIISERLKSTFVRFRSELKHRRGEIHLQTQSSAEALKTTCCSLRSFFRDYTGFSPFSYLFTKQECEELNGLLCQELNACVKAFLSCKGIAPLRKAASSAPGGGHQRRKGEGYINRRAGIPG
ncbi:hypothetical protein MHYP_G00111910 [Metynnis hypsauchen]